MNCDYVRENYRVPAEIGRRVEVNGRPGIIAADRGHYIGVNFDDDKPGCIRNAHPTADVTYHDMGRVRPQTVGQKRYQDYLDVGDCFESFIHYLRYRSSLSKQ